MVDNILFLRPSAAVAARLPASLRALFSRSVCGPFGAARCAFFFRRVPLFLRPFWPRRALLAFPSSRRPSGSASLASHLPADAGSLLRSSARSARGAPLLCAGAFASRSSPSCVFLAPLRLRRSFVFLPCFFLLPAAGGGVAPLPFVPVPLLPFRQSGPRLRLCLSSRLWRLFSSPLFLLPFSFPCPSPLATFSLPLLLSCPLWLGHSYGCFWDIFFFLLFMVRLSHGRGEGEDIE